MPESLLKQALKQFHNNHMGIKKTNLLAHKSIHWKNMDADIQKHIKITLNVLIFQQTQPREKDYIPQNPSKNMGDSLHRYVQLIQ